MKRCTGFFRHALGFLTVALASFSICDTDHANASPNAPQASQALLEVLREIQKLDNVSVLAVQTWASNPRPEAPDTVLSDSDSVEKRILGLEPAERNAVISWLNHGGRAKLFAVGATDADIGVCLPQIDPAGCKAAPAAPSASPALLAAQSAPASTNHHDLPFKITFEASSGGGIVIERGFAAVQNNATSETHCLTFKNVGPKTAAAVTFAFRLNAKSGEVLYAGSNIRVGTFSPGAEVAGPNTMNEFQESQNGKNKSLLDNCWTMSGGSSNGVMLRASYLTMQVSSVTYEDATHWSR